MIVLKKLSVFLFLSFGIFPNCCFAQFDFPSAVGKIEAMTPKDHLATVPHDNYSYGALATVTNTGSLPIAATLHVKVTKPGGLLVDEDSTIVSVMPGQSFVMMIMESYGEPYSEINEERIVSATLVVSVDWGLVAGGEPFEFLGPPLTLDYDSVFFILKYYA